MDAKLTRQIAYGLFLLIVLGMLRRVEAQTALNVAVAANFAPAMKEIGKRFTAQTGVPVQLTISSSGRLYAQINNLAPFDLYLSADSGRPELLFNDGRCEEPKLYARGKSVLWSRNAALCGLKGWKEVLRSAEVKKIAMPNPDTAPYGTVARDACQQLDNWLEIEQKFVFGGNVGQSFQYAATGVADAAFIAQSLALTDTAKAGCTWEVQGYATVSQKGCVIRYGPNKKEAEQLLEYVTSNTTADIRERFGYR
jgi:molybdate transport system substrate-binding protein